MAIRTVTTRVAELLRLKRQWEQQIEKIKKKISKLNEITDKKKRKQKARKLQEKLENANAQLTKVLQQLKVLQISYGDEFGELIENAMATGGTNINDALDQAPSKNTGIDQVSRYLLAKKMPAESFSDNNLNLSVDSNMYLSDSMSNYAKAIFHSNNMFSEKELDIFHKTYRYGYYNTRSVTYGREFLFFTRPDLNIVDSEGHLQKFYNGLTFWKDLHKYRPNVVYSLQLNYPEKRKNMPANDPFNHLLQNQCISSMDIPGLSSAMIETPVNDYGVGYNYRGSSEASDDNPEFSLEFKDDRDLNVFHFFKAYEYYETLKHHGSVAPRKEYIINRVIHDQFAIFKFIVAEDMETLLYWGKMYGVCPKSLPRDAFSNAIFENGISYSVDFQAAFYEDMIPDILADFNYISKRYYNSLQYNIDVYNSELGAIDGRAAKAAMVKPYYTNKSHTKFVWKLKWKGDDEI